MTHVPFEEQAMAAEPWSRRQFLSGLAASTFRLSMVPALAGQVLGNSTSLFHPASARRCIFLYMSGGMSQIDTLDPKPESENAGELRALSTAADGIQLSEHFPYLAKQMDKATVIRSMTSTQGAHEQGRYFLHTSHVLRGTIRHPSLGSWMSHLQGSLNQTLPGHVAVGNGRQMASCGFLEAVHGPLPIGDPSMGLANSKIPDGVDVETFQHRLDRLAHMNESFSAEFGNKDVRAYNEAYESAVRLMDSSDLRAFAISEEPEGVRDSYGRNRFGQGCLLARRLIEHDVRFVEVALGGWDHHNDIFDSLEGSCPNLDRALASLLADLDARGLLEDTLVVLATEFGRTPRISDRAGRDHYPKSFSALLAGGGIKRGFVYGATSPDGTELEEKPVPVTDFNATLGWALGLPLEQEQFSPSGRPFRIADQGRPIMELFA